MTDDKKYLAAATITASLLAQYESDLPITSLIEKVSPTFQLVLSQMEAAEKAYGRHKESNTLIEHMLALRESLS